MYFFMHSINYTKSLPRMEFLFNTYLAFVASFCIPCNESFSDKHYITGSYSFPDS